MHSICFFHSLSFKHILNEHLFTVNSFRVNDDFIYVLIGNATESSREREYFIGCRVSGLTRDIILINSNEIQLKTWVAFDLTTGPVHYSYGVMR